MDQSNNEKWVSASRIILFAIQSKDKKWVSTSRIILFAISSIIPLLIIVKAFINLCKHAPMTLCEILACCILPLGAIALLSAWNFNPLRTVWRVIADIVVLAALVFLVLFCFLIGPIDELEHYEQTEVAAQYTEVQGEIDAMPGLDEIGTPLKTDYFVFQRGEYIFERYAYTLVCTYDSSEYEQQKAMLDQTYVFQTEDMEAHSYSCTPYAEIDGYEFRVLSVDYVYKYLDFPKYMVFIATNDDTKQIVYMFYEDPDIDYISEPLDKHIKSDCGWKYISKRIGDK